jgi:hypothetical protein
MLLRLFLGGALSVAVWAMSATACSVRTPPPGEANDSPVDQTVPREPHTSAPFTPQGIASIAWGQQLLPIKAPHTSTLVDRLTAPGRLPRPDVSPGGFTVEDLVVPVLTSATIVQVNWNVDGVAVNPDLSEQMSLFYKDLSGSAYLAALAIGYQGAGTNLGFLGPYSISAATAPLRNGTGNIPGTNIGVLLQREINAGKLPAPAPGYIYAVHPSQMDTTWVNPFGATCWAGNPPGGFTAWHYSWQQNGLTVPFMLIPQETPGATCSSVGSPGYTAGLTGAGPINEETYWASHELVETLVDPPGTFINTEVGDPCELPGGAQATKGIALLSSNNGPPWFLNPFLENDMGCSIGIFGWNSEAYKSSGFVTPRGPYHLDAFSPDSTGTVRSSWWDMTANGNARSGPQNASNWNSYTVPGPPGLFFAGTPVAADSRVPPILGNTLAGAQTSGKLDIFLGDINGNLETNYWTETPGWASNFYDPLDEAAPPNVAVVSRTSALLDVILCDVNGTLHDRSWSDLTGSWTDVTLPRVVNVNFAPGCNVTAISEYATHIDAFVVDNIGHLWNYYYDTTYSPPGWQVPQDLTANTRAPSLVPYGQVSAIGRHPTHQDVFSTDENGSVWNYWWDFNLYNARWQYAGPVITGASPGAPVAVDDQGAEDLDVFTTGTSQGGPVLIATWWNIAFPEGWSGHQFAIPGSGQAFYPQGTLQLGGAWPRLHSISRLRGAIDVFGLGSDGSMWSWSWTNANVANGTGGAWDPNPRRVL